ncbi:MAG: helix-turn-helix domain-containing protein [Gammaproteobacteria bacterium]|nr:helix-turn-helix domain-containing protein [Gammaproteobacteria bacterium]
MSFGYALRMFREERGLSLREFGKLCEIDHAYIHRLEKGEKTSPSGEVVESFARTLKLSSRRARLLRLLVGKTMNEQLIDVFIKDEDRPLELLEPLAQMSFRGKRPETPDDWRRQADRLNAFLGEQDD